MASAAVRMTARAAARRASARAWLDGAGLWLACAAAGALLLTVIGKFGYALPGWPMLLSASLAAAILGGSLAAWRHRLPQARAARELDARLALKDRLGTALAFETSAANPFERLAVDEGERAATSVIVADAFRIAPRGTWYAGPALLAATVLAALYLPPLSSPAPAPDARAERREAAESLRAASEAVAAITGPQPDDPLITRELESVRQLEEELNGGAKPAEARAQAARSVERIAEQFEQRAGRQEELAQHLRESLSRAAQEARATDPGREAGGESAAFQELADSLRQGDLARAQEAAADAARNLDRMTPAERQALASELRDLARALQETQSSEPPGPSPDAQTSAEPAPASQPQTPESPGQPPAGQPPPQPGPAPDDAREQQRRQLEALQRDLENAAREAESSPNQSQPGRSDQTSPNQPSAPNQPGAPNQPNTPNQPDGPKQPGQGSPQTDGPRPSGEQPPSPQPGPAQPPKSGAESRPSEQPGSRPEQPQPGTQPQPGAQPQPGPGSPPTPQPSPQPSAPTPAPSGTQPQPGSSPQPGAQPQPGQQPQPPPTGQPAPQPQPGAQPGQPQPQSQTQPQSQPGPGQPGSQPQPQSGDQPQAQPGNPQSGAQPRPTPAPGQPGAQPAPAPQPQPGPQEGPGQGQPQQAPGSAMEQLARRLGQAQELAERARRDEKTAQELRRQAEELLNRATPEERRRLEELARQLGRQPGNPQSPDEAPDAPPGQGPGLGPRSADAAKTAEPAPWQGEQVIDARPKVQDRDLSSSPQREAARWSGDAPGRGDGPVVPAATSERARQAARGLERAIEQQAVPAPYTDIVRRVQRRYAQRASTAPAPAPASVPDAPDAGTRPREPR